MDRELAPGYRIRKHLKRTALGVSIVAVGALALVYGPELLRPSVNRNRIRTARVDEGPIAATISAAGIVEAEVEHIVSSPITTRVLSVLRQPGAQLKKGEPLVELDTSQSSLALEKLAQQIDLKQNQQAQERLVLENTLVSLSSQRDIQRLELDSLRANAERMRRLVQDGLATLAELDLAQVKERKAQVELEQLEQKMAQARQLTQVKLDGLAMEMAILRRELAEAERQLRLATAAADRPGVLTWIVPEAGVTVRQGENLARIANLSAFRVKANLSDIHAGRLAAGLPAEIRIGDAVLAGRVRQVLPAVENGVISLLVGLDEPANPRLRPNLRVDVRIVTESKAWALRVRRGPAVQEAGEQEIFVVRENTAFRQTARFGVADFEHFEVLGGLAAGDEVIISDMTDYRHLREVKIK